MKTGKVRLSFVILLLIIIVFEGRYRKCRNKDLGHSGI